MKKLSAAIASPELQRELDALIESRLARERKRLQTEHQHEIQTLIAEHIETVAELRVEIIALQTRRPTRGLFARLLS